MLRLIIELKQWSHIVERYLNIYDFQACIHMQTNNQVSHFLKTHSKSNQINNDIALFLRLRSKLVIVSIFIAYTIKLKHCMLHHLEESFLTVKSYKVKIEDFSKKFRIKILIKGENSFLLSLLTRYEIKGISYSFYNRIIPFPTYPLSLYKKIKQDIMQRIKHTG